MPHLRSKRSALAERNQGIFCANAAASAGAFLTVLTAKRYLAGRLAG
jgi:hypothetical protein